ncbi:MAG: aromatic ring-hydroxylating dioxygenase subunit alpha [Gammaproteobacteria bacterium]|nr:aromatic ring-hydroxylating dioxygenase subunit alpha [Gammaproteobacteria bacterium]
MKAPPIDLKLLRSAAYNGYNMRYSVEVDEELTRVGPGTQCGEYLRRFWHPVAISSELTDLPVAARVLGEDLVLFRDQRGQVGLVHKRCPHRRASLEFGTCAKQGIRCCYHGWLFDVDGTLLEAPGQPKELAERLKKRIRLGAYPALEYKGLVFAYMGPPQEIPDFPIYDTLELPDMEMVPYKAPFRCNWLQVLDAIVDPIHTSFLHSNISRTQFSEGFGEVGQMDFLERDVWLLGVNTRRVGDNIWFRVNELVLPNFTQAGAAFATDGTAKRYYGRSAFSRWVVPLDDENTVAFAWANFGKRGDPPEWNTPEGPELIEQGEVFDRPYEQRQRFPGDAEAVEGMGKITIHENENLVVSDKGIALMRRRLRQQIRDVAKGLKPSMVTDLKPNPIPTYGGDSVITIPANSDGDESQFLSRLAHEFVEAQFAVDDMQEDERVAFVTERLKQIESRCHDNTSGG